MTVLDVIVIVGCVGLWVARLALWEALDYIEYDFDSEPACAALRDASSQHSCIGCAAAQTNGPGRMLCHSLEDSVLRRAKTCVDQWPHLFS
eukprot:SAG31_NODE_63_length_28659_cov_23.074685_8_plen_91_part_00